MKKVAVGVAATEIKRGILHLDRGDLCYVVQELQTQDLEKEDGQLDQIAWADQGRLLSVSSRSGCLYTFLIHSQEPPAPDTLTESVLIETVKPLGPGAVLLSFLSTGAVLSVLGASALGVSYRDFFRILLGTSETM